MTAERGRGPDSPQVRPYDFRSPERLTSRTRRHLEPNQELLAERIGEALSTLLAVPCSIRFEKLTERSTEAFLGEGHDPSFRLRPAAGRREIFLRVQTRLAQAFIDRLLGGVGDPRDVERPPTDIEAAVLGMVAAEVSGSTARSWNAEPGAAGESTFLTRKGMRGIKSISGLISTFTLRFGEDAPSAEETPEEEAAEAPPEEAEAEVTEGETAESADAALEEEAPGDDSLAGRFRIFFHYDDLAEILGFGKGDTGPGEGDEHVTTAHLAAVALPLSARYRPTPVAIRDITSLRLGDVLYLDHKPTDEVEVRVGREFAFYGNPGAVDGSIGVRISRSK